MKVIIDPGHGGKDPGTVYPPGARRPYLREKDITLRAAKFLKDQLERRGAEVILTREKDEYLTLKERAEIALREGAEFFISIHVNSAGSAKAHGWEVWYHDEEHVSFGWAKKICAELRKQDIVGEHGRNPRSDYQRYRTGFGVLRRLRGKIPGVLVELGFITNKGDRRALVNPLTLEKLTKRIAGAIMPTPVAPEVLIPVVFEGEVVGRAKVVEGRSYLVTPLRNFVEALGMEVGWTGKAIEVSRKEKGGSEG